MAENLTTTQQILDHHLEAFGAGDLGRLMLDYTESSVLIGPEHTLTGLAAIRAFFEGVFQGFPGRKAANTAFTAPFILDNVWFCALARPAP